MKANQRVKLVDPDCEDEREIKRDYLKLKIVETYDTFIKKNCSHDGEIKFERKDGISNPIKDLNSVKERVIAKEIIVDETDKTNRISVMKYDTYLNAMEEHHRDDKLITKKELNKIEKR